MNSILFMSPRNRPWNAIDLVKLFMAFCVVAIHTDPLHAYRGTWVFTVYDSITRCAVPFFFLASGFLFGHKMQTPLASKRNLPLLCSFLIKFIKFYLIWNVVYLPLALSKMDYQGRTPLYNVVTYLVGFVFRGEHYNSWQLWYLLATVYVVLIIIVLTRLHVPFAATVGICFSIYVFGLFLDWLGVQDTDLPTLLSWIRTIQLNTVLDGRIFRGFLFLPVGILFSRKVFRPIFGSILFVTGFVLVCVLHGVASEAALAMCVTGLFCTVQALPLKDSRFYPFVRQMSTVIYFIHMYVWTSLYWILYRKPTQGICMFLMTVVVSAALSAGYICLREKGRRTQTI